MSSSNIQRGIQNIWLITKVKYQFNDVHGTDVSSIDTAALYGKLAKRDLSTDSSAHMLLITKERLAGLMYAYLLSRLGIFVTHCRSADEAYTKYLSKNHASHYNFSMVVVDWSVGPTTGYDLMRLVRGDGNTKIVWCALCGKGVLPGDAVRAGVDLFFRKPLLLHAETLRSMLLPRSMALPGFPVSLLRQPSNYNQIRQVFFERDPGSEDGPVGVSSVTSTTVAVQQLVNEVLQEGEDGAEEMNEAFVSDMLQFVRSQQPKYSNQRWHHFLESAMTSLKQAKSALVRMTQEANAARRQAEFCWQNHQDIEPTDGEKRDFASMSRRELVVKILQLTRRNDELQRLLAVNESDFKKIVSNDAMLSESVNVIRQKYEQQQNASPHQKQSSPSPLSAMKFTGDAFGKRPAPPKRTASSASANGGANRLASSTSLNELQNAERSGRNSKDNSYAPPASREQTPLTTSLDMSKRGGKPISPQVTLISPKLVQSTQELKLRVQLNTIVPPTSGSPAGAPSQSANDIEGYLLSLNQRMEEQLMYLEDAASRAFNNRKRQLDVERVLFHLPWPPILRGALPVVYDRVRQALELVMAECNELARNAIGIAPAVHPLFQEFEFRVASILGTDPSFLFDLSTSSLPSTAAPLQPPPPVVEAALPSTKPPARRRASEAGLLIQQSDAFGRVTPIPVRVVNKWHNRSIVEIRIAVEQGLVRQSQALQRRTELHRLGRFFTLWLGFVLGARANPSEFNDMRKMQSITVLQKKGSMKKRTSGASSPTMKDPSISFGTPMAPAVPSPSNKKMAKELLSSDSPSTSGVFTRGGMESKPRPPQLAPPVSPSGQDIVTLATPIGGKSLTPNAAKGVNKPLPITAKAPSNSNSSVEIPQIASMLVAEPPKGGQASASRRPSVDQSAGRRLPPLSLS